MNYFSELILFSLVFFQLANASYMHCVESDGGKIFNVKGDLNYSYMSVPGPSDWMTYIDYCSYGSIPANNLGINFRQC